MNISHESDEYSYYAALLVFGSQSSRIERFNQYSFDAFRNDTRLSLKEINMPDPNGSPDIIRHLSLSDGRSIYTSHSKMATGVSRIVTLSDPKAKMSLSDAIFTDDDYQYFKGDWNDISWSKIRTLGTLIRCALNRDLREVLKLVNEFPNISKALLGHHQRWAGKIERIS